MHRKVDCKVKFTCQEDISGDVWKMNFFGQEAAGVRRWSGCQPVPGQRRPTAGGPGRPGGKHQVQKRSQKNGPYLGGQVKKTTTERKPQALFDERFHCMEIDDSAYF